MGRLTVYFTVAVPVGLTEVFGGKLASGVNSHTGIPASTAVIKQKALKPTLSWVIKRTNFITYPYVNK
jgi:hypothetical protein